MTSWTLEQVGRLAPDAASAAAGRALAITAKWQGLAQQGELIWGLCQGSGKEPYRAVFATAAASWKCSCPSRKQPCKHSLALIGLYAQWPAAFSAAEPPDWVADWQARRAERQQKAEAREAAAVPGDGAADTDTNTDPEAAAQAAAEAEAQTAQQARKRLQARRARMQEGLDEFRRWLHDLARQGVAARLGGLPAELEARARRLVDAQCPALADALREAGAALALPDGQNALLECLARGELLASAFARLDELPAGLAADVRAALGWPTPQDEALAAPAWSGLWRVVGCVDEARDERLRSQRVWLVEQGNLRLALVLQYAFGSQPFAQQLPLGSAWQGDLHPYPSATPGRVAVGAWQPAPPPAGLRVPLARTCAELVTLAGALFAANPFLQQAALALQGVLWVEGERWSVVDAQGEALPVRAEPGLWRLLALAAGQPANWFCEWDGRRLRVLSLLGAIPHADAAIQPAAEQTAGESSGAEPPAGSGSMAGSAVGSAAGSAAHSTAHSIAGAAP